MQLVLTYQEQDVDKVLQTSMTAGEDTAIPVLEPGVFVPDSGLTPVRELARLLGLLDEGDEPSDASQRRKQD